MAGTLVACAVRVLVWSYAARTLLPLPRREPWPAEIQKRAPPLARYDSGWDLAILERGYGPAPAPCAVLFERHVPRVALSAAPAGSARISPARSPGRSGSLRPARGHDSPDRPRPRGAAGDRGLPGRADGRTALTLRQPCAAARSSRRSCARGGRRSLGLRLGPRGGGAGTLLPCPGSLEPGDIAVARRLALRQAFRPRRPWAG